MSNKLHRIDGIKLANGKQAYGSYEMSLWLPTFTRYMKEIHKINLVWIKVADLSPTAASAATHVGGYAGDSRTWNLTAKQQQLVVEEGTRFGYPNHRRVRSQGFDPHNHGMLDVGYRTNCSYQITATKMGRDGLARNREDLDKAYRPAQPWMDWKEGLEAMLRILEPPKPVVITPIPRYYTAKPWSVIPVDGVKSGLFWSRVHWQLNLKPTTDIPNHWTVRALKVWLGNEDDGTGILSPLNVQQLQYRVGAVRDGVWGPETTKAFQRYLNNNR